MFQIQVKSLIYRLIYYLMQPLWNRILNYFLQNYFIKNMINEQLKYDQHRRFDESKEICSATISPDEKYLVFGGYSKELNIIDIVLDKLVSSIQYLEYISLCLFSKDQEFLFVGDHKGQLFCYDSNYKLYFQAPIHKQQIRKIALKSNTQPITCSSDRSIKITDIQLKTLILTIDMAHSDTIKALYYESNTIVSGGRDCTINLYNTDSGKVIIQKLNAHPYCVFQIQMIQQKSKLISLCEGCNLKIWKLDLDGEQFALTLIKQLTDISNIQNCYGLDNQIVIICIGYVKLLDQELNLKQTIHHDIPYFENYDVKQVNSLNYIMLLGQKQIVLFKKAQ
ncbi:hypothetical protein pb186bvf_002667 [Paramecium bursaria]